MATNAEMEVRAAWERVFIYYAPSSASWVISLQDSFHTFKQRERFEDAIADALVYTRQRKEEEQQLKADIEWVEYKMYGNSPAASRILARLQAALVEVQRGMKQAKA